MRRSIRLRVFAASILAVTCLGSMVCIVLPQAYEHQGKKALRERAEVLARSTSQMIQRDVLETGLPTLAPVASWLDGEPDFSAAALLDAEGRVVESWPEATVGWGGEPSPTPTVYQGAKHFRAIHPMAPGRSDVAAVGVRLSTDRIRSDFQNVRWLFASIFLFICGVFWVLTTYIASGILKPLEEIRQAAMALADGEPFVNVPDTGDHEIDELGEYIATLGSKRRASTVMASPVANYLKSKTRKAARPTIDPDESRESP